MAKTYGTYKDSGIAWIGEIPGEWRVEKARHIFTQRNSKGNKTPILLSATQINGMYPQHLLEGVVQVQKSTDLQTFKTVHKNDYVISLRSFQGGFEMSDYEGVCSPAYQVFYNKIDICHQYYKLLFKSQGFISMINSLVVGIREGKNIQYGSFSYSYLPFPPLSVQQSISSFLDTKCGEIDSLISIQEEMISELLAYKQSVITEAVTKGLDKKAKMKNSGVEWIGDIPEEWEVRRIKNICIMGPTDDYSHPYESVGYAPMNTIRYGNINAGIIEKSKLSSGLTYFADNDIVMAKVTPCFENGNIAIAKNLHNGCAYGSSELFVFRATNILTEFLFYLLQNEKFKGLCCSTMTGTGGLKRVSPSFVYNSFIPLPPLPVQQAIATYLDEKTSQIDSLIALKQSKIESLKEYKKSIIYEYVTGKKRV